MWGFHPSDRVSRRVFLHDAAGGCRPPKLVPGNRCQNCRSRNFRTFAGDPEYAIGRPTHTPITQDRVGLLSAVAFRDALGARGRWWAAGTPSAGKR